MLTIWILLIIFSFVTVMVIVSNYFSYKEKKMMVEKGADSGALQGKPQYQDESHPLTKLANLRSGVTLIFVGGALTIGLSFIGWGVWLLGGLIPLFLGIARMTLYYLLPPEE